MSFSFQQMNFVSNQLNSSYHSLQPLSLLARNRRCISTSFQRYGYLRINVGGCIFELKVVNINKLPHSRLGRLVTCESTEEIWNLCDDYCSQTNQVFYDRNPDIFQLIAEFYHTGKLHMPYPEQTCLLHFCEELLFWGIDEIQLQNCCQQRYFQNKERMNYDLKNKEKEAPGTQIRRDVYNPALLENSKYIRFKKRLWDLMDKPQTSYAARVISAISIFFILLSTLTMTLGTIPSLQNRSSNGTATFENIHLFQMERVCMVWFSIEYLVRFFSSPERCHFCKGPLNMIDLIAMLPYYISLLVDETSRSGHQQFEDAKRVVQVFRIARVFRILKLARYSLGLQTLGMTFRKSYQELGLLASFISVGIVIFSSLAYFAEKDENPLMFSSIPETFWWAAITMTTVGYGDVYPKTIWGKFVGSACCICGVLVIAMPIPIIVNNFTQNYREQLNNNKVVLRKKVIERNKDGELILKI